MADEKEVRRLIEEFKQQQEIEAGEKWSSANPPNESKERPAAPGGSGGSETGQRRQE